MKRHIMQVTVGVLAFFMGAGSAKISTLSHFHRPQPILITDTDLHLRRDEMLAKELMKGGLGFTLTKGDEGENGFAHHFLSSDGIHVMHCNWLARTPQDAELTRNHWSGRIKQVLERSTYGEPDGERCERMIGVIPNDFEGKPNYSVARFCGQRYEAVVSPSLAHALAYESSLATSQSTRY